MAAPLFAICRRTNTPPEIQAGALADLAEDDTAGAVVCTLTAVDAEGGPYRWERTVNAKFELSADNGNTVDVRLSAAGEGNIEAGTDEFVTVRLYDKWGEFDERSLTVSPVLGEGGADVAPTYVATATINTNDGVADGTLLRRHQPTNSPSPASVTFEIDAGSNSTDFEVEADGADCLFRVKAGANLTALIGSPPDVQVNWTHDAGTGSFTFTVNVADASAEFLIGTFSFLNNTGSGIPAGSFPESFGFALPQGLVPAGSYTQLRHNDGTTPCESLLLAPNYHPDGSLRSAGYVARIDEETANGESAVLQLWKVNSAPGTSGWDLSDLAGMGDAGISLTGETGGNMDGTWVSSFQDAVADDEYSYTFADGDLGLWCVIHKDFESAGSPHVHARGIHSVLKLKALGGGVAGYAYRARASQVTTDANTASMASRLVNGFIYEDGVSNKIRDLDGHGASKTSTGAQIRWPHYSEFFFSADHGRYDWIQGDGSVASRGGYDPPRFDLDLFMSARMLPPLDTTQTVSGNTTVESYKPGGKGGIVTDTANTWAFAQSETGFIEKYQTKALLRQDANDFRTVRTSALSCAHWRRHFRRAATRQPVVSNNGPDNAGGTYTGLGAPQPTWRYRGDGNYTGFGDPPVTNTSLWGNESLTGHLPNTVYLAWLLFREPEFLELLADQFVMSTFTQTGGVSTLSNSYPVVDDQFPGTPTRHMTFDGTTYYGVAFWATSISRVRALLTRDVLYFWLGCPAVHPEGVALFDLADDILDSSLAFANAVIDDRSQDWQDAGLFYFEGDPGENFWNFAMFDGIIGVMAACTGKAAAATLNAKLGKKWVAIDAAGDIAAVAAYQCRMYDENSVQIEKAEELLTTLQVTGVTITSSVATNRFTAAGFTPADGMLFAQINSNSVPFAAMVNGKHFVAINTVGQTFQLADPAAPSTPETIDTDTTLPHGNNTFFALVGEEAGIKAYQGNNMSSGGYFARTRGGMLCAQAGANATGVPIAGLADVIAKVQARSTIDFSSDQLWAFADSYPEAA